MNSSHHLPHLVVFTLCNGYLEPGMWYMLHIRIIVATRGEIGGALYNIYLAGVGGVFYAIGDGEGDTCTQLLQPFGAHSTLYPYQVGAFMCIFAVEKQAGNFLISGEYQQAFGQIIQPPDGMNAFGEIVVQMPEAPVLCAYELREHRAGLVNDIVLIFRQGCEGKRNNGNGGTDSQTLQSMYFSIPYRRTPFSNA